MRPQDYRDRDRGGLLTTGDRRNIRQQLLQQFRRKPLPLVRHIGEDPAHHPHIDGHTTWACVPCCRSDRVIQGVPFIGRRLPFALQDRAQTLGQICACLQVNQGMQGCKAAPIGGAAPAGRLLDHP